MKKIMKMMSMLVVSILIFGTIAHAADTVSEENNVIFGIEKSTEVEEPVDPVEPEDPQPYSYKVVTQSGNLNVRKGPGTSYAIVGRVAKGSIVECSFMQPADAGKNWLYGSGKDVDTGKRITGYMRADYLECVVD